MEIRDRLCVNICNRAHDMGICNTTMLTALMDVETADKEFNLRLADLLDASDEDFARDFCGIQGNVNRKTKTFGDFIPRFAG